MKRTGPGTNLGFTLTILVDEMLYAQSIDVGTIGGALKSEIGAEISAVGAYGCSQLLQGDVVSQI